MHARVSVHPCVCVGRARVRRCSSSGRERRGPREKGEKRGKKARTRPREKEKEKKRHEKKVSERASERASAKARKRTTGYKDPLLAYIKAT